MKLYAIILFTQQNSQVKLVGTSTDVSSFGYFERSRWVEKEGKMENKRKKRENKKRK